MGPDSSVFLILQAYISASRSHAFRLMRVRVVTRTAFDCSAEKGPDSAIERVLSFLGVFMQINMSSNNEDQRALVVLVKRYFV